MTAQYVMKEKRRAEIKRDKKETTLWAPPSTNEIALIKSPNPSKHVTFKQEIHDATSSRMSGWVHEPMFNMHKPQCEHHMCAWECGWVNNWNWWCRCRMQMSDVCMWMHPSECYESWCDYQHANMNVNECGCECITTQCLCPCTCNHYHTAVPTVPSTEVCLHMH